MESDALGSNESKMVSERTFARICDYIPFSVPKIEKKKPMKLWFNVALLLFQIWNIWLIQDYVYILEEQDNFETFALKINMVSYATSTAVYAYHYLLADYFDNISLEDLQKLDASLNVSLSLQFDHWLFLLLAQMFLHFLSLAYILGMNYANRSVWSLDLAMSSITLIQVTAFNSMISKRLKTVVTSYQESPGGEDVEINCVRKMFAIVKRLEKCYSVKTGAAFLREFVVLVHSLLVYWKIYGLKHYSAGSIEFNHPWITISGHHQFVWELLALGLATEMISNEVGKGFSFY